jgi:hypothetical protein
LNGTDEQHHPDASTPWLFRNTPETFGDLSPITRANQNALVDFPHEFVMGKMNDAPLDHDRDLAVLGNAASDLRALQSDVPPRSPTPNAYHTDLARLASAGGMMITVAAIIPVALVAGSLIGVLLNARLASRRRQSDLRGPQLDEFVQSAFQALRELRVRSEVTAKLGNAAARGVPIGSFANLPGGIGSPD